jgi:hypothetical protein
MLTDGRANSNTAVIYFKRSRAAGLSAEVKIRQANLPRMKQDCTGMDRRSIYGTEYVVSYICMVGCAADERLYRILRHNFKKAHPI